MFHMQTRILVDTCSIIILSVWKMPIQPLILLEFVQYYSVRKWHVYSQVLYCVTRLNMDTCHMKCTQYGVFYMEGSNMKVCRDRHMVAGTGVIGNLCRVHHGNRDMCEVTICAFYHRSIWTRVGLILWYIKRLNVHTCMMKSLQDAGCQYGHMWGENLYFPPSVYNNMSQI